MYLRRAVKRRFGTEITVLLVDPERSPRQESEWVNERPLPLVIIDGKLFSKGSLSLKEVIQELQRLKGKN